MYQLDENALNRLSLTILECGRLAKERQAYIHRSYKEDGSVLTETDLEISKKIELLIKELFPECGFISEEAEVDTKRDVPYTFVLDPIDGTDVYSQGLPSFAVALGILDSKKRPVGAMIYLPRFGKARDDMFIRLDPGKKLLVDNHEFSIDKSKDKIKQITMGSSGQKKMDFSHFSGKVRTFGSSILHLIAPIVFDNIEACVNQPCFVWDIASSHAVLLNQGMDIEYVDGEKFIYTDEFLYEKKKFKKDIYAATKEGIKYLRKKLPIRVK